MDNKLFNRFKDKVESLSGEIFYARDAEAAGDLVSRMVYELGSPVVGLADSPLIDRSGLKEKIAALGAAVFDSNLGAHGVDLVLGISEMDLGIAETGTLAQDAFDLEKRIVSMLPEVHFALLQGKNIVSGLSDALNFFYRKGIPPGYIAFISGPSRTADIERVLTIGVHGPGKLVVVVVDEAGEGKNRGKKRA